jgi:hypothetical protein
MPFLERFINDWAIEKYGHLKANAQKRNRNGSCKKKALSASVASRNRASTSAGNQGQHGIRVAGTRLIDDDDDDEEVDNEGPGQGSDEEEEE